MRNADCLGVVHPPPEGLELLDDLGQALLHGDAPEAPHGAHALRKSRAVHLHVHPALWRCEHKVGLPALPEVCLVDHGAPDGKPDLRLPHTLVETLVALADAEEVVAAEGHDLYERHGPRTHRVHEVLRRQNHVLADHVITCQQLRPTQAGASSNHRHGVPVADVLVGAEHVPDKALRDGDDHLLLQVSHVPDAIASLVHARLHCKLTLQTSREPLHGALLVPLPVHIEGLVEVLTEAVSQRGVEVPVLHEKIQVIHELTGLRGELVDVRDDVYEVRQHPGPEDA
mmetsp:Transcript_88928/g.288008  ORF Transcript_88928/g.288008 Transcript_88928/m.288008 type:complete len:285 (-) Transcript_88928:899-1753(-)